MSIVNLVLGCGFAGYAGYKLLTSGASDMLGLNKLRHGTSLPNYIKIQLCGANPNLGGTGEAQLLGYAGNGANENRFFVWNDQFNGQGKVNAHWIVQKILNTKFLHPVSKRVGAKYYNVLGGISSFTCERAPLPLKRAFQVIGGLTGLLTPTLDFYCAPEEWKRDFTVDTALHPVARYTTKRLSSLKYIGLTGVLYQGFSRGILTRIANSPGKFLTGIGKIALVAGLILSMLAILATYAKVRVYNGYQEIVRVAHASPQLIATLTKISLALPFAALAIA